MSLSLCLSLPAKVCVLSLGYVGHNIRLSNQTKTPAWLMPKGLNCLEYLILKCSFEMLLIQEGYYMHNLECCGVINMSRTHVCDY